jgi:hypothetical protein
VKPRSFVCPYRCRYGSMLLFVAPSLEIKFEHGAGKQDCPVG